EFAVGLQGGLFTADGLGFVNGRFAGLQHMGRDEEVVHGRLVDGYALEKLLADGVDAAVGPDDDAKLAFQLLDFRFQVPVDAFADTQGRIARVVQDQAAANAADARILEMGQQLLQGVAQQHGIGVAEYQDVSRGPGNELVQDRGLSAALGKGQQLYARRVFRYDGVGPVRGGIRADQDFQVLAREFQIEGVADLLLDHLLLVVGRDDHGDFELVRIALFAPQGEELADERKGDRIQKIGVEIGRAA